MIAGRPGEATNTADMPEKADLREAYEHGRRDERARRRRHPIGMTITFALALVGLVILGLAAFNGSFGAAGQMVDRSLSIAANQGAPMATQAAANAGQSLRDATASVRARTSDATG